MTTQDPALVYGVDEPALDSNTTVRTEEDTVRPWKPCATDEAGRIYPHALMRVHTGSWYLAYHA